MRRLEQDCVAPKEKVHASDQLVGSQVCIVTVQSMHVLRV